jgi:hypothetical protein
LTISAEPDSSKPILETNHPTDEDLSVGTLVDLDSAVHGLICFCYFLIWKSLLLFFRFSSSGELLLAGRFGLDADGPDKANSSRAIAVTVFRCFLPGPIRFK